MAASDRPRIVVAGSFRGVAATAGEGDFLDAETMARLAATLIEQAHAQGNCVIVGRGGQCVLQRRQDVFHVYIYAPWSRESGARASASSRVGRIPKSTSARWTACAAEYVRRNYSCTWADPHLYHLLVSSQLGEEAGGFADCAAVASVKP